MGISVHGDGDVRVVRMSGEYTIGGGGLMRTLDLRGQHLSDLSDTLRTLLDRGCRRIVLDLERVTFFDSAGLGELIAWRKRTVERGGDIVLLRPTGKVRDLLVMLRLDRMFRIFDQEPEALAAAATAPVIPAKE
jgi:anti-sigma B factor antagonist